MSFLLVLWFACLLDLLFGDPRWFPHPVRLIGWFATRMEIFTRSLPQSAQNSGRLTVLLVLLITGSICAAALFMLFRLPLPGFLAGAAFVLYTTIAARDLIRHARRVYEALGIDLEAARRRVAMIVGRDTDQLDESGIIRACVESVAENMSDGIVAPLFWATVGAVFAVPAGGMWPVVCGVTAAMLYKAVNTMDSMFGYKNEQYREFGSCSARLDDVVNFFPARLSGLALVLAAPLCNCSLKNSWAVLWRDRAKHTSPNAGWPEAAVAGALGLQLGGDSCYFGNLTSKPVLGDLLHPPVPNHILRANRLILTASTLCLLCFTFGYLFLRFFL
jgi:adenosylcobinamide-phosphate synthase